MRLRAIVAALLFTVLTAGLAQIPSAQAADSYCPNPAHSRPEKVPPDLVARVASAFNIDAAAVRDAAFVRCVGGKLMGCTIGANLVCDKADTRRTLPGATAWCRDHPGSADIPMAATSHATIYAWSCRGRRAIAGKTVLTVDPQGYIAENWQVIR